MNGAETKMTFLNVARVARRLGAAVAVAAAVTGGLALSAAPAENIRLVGVSAQALGRNAAEAEAMVAAVESAGVPNTVWYNYRRVPAVTLAKQFGPNETTTKELMVENELPGGEVGVCHNSAVRWRRDLFLSRALLRGTDRLRVSSGKVAAHHVHGMGQGSALSM